MKNKQIMLALIIIVSLLVIDQLSKFLILKYYSEDMLDGFIGIQIVENTGMAFGLNKGNKGNIFLIIFVLGIILNFIRTQKERIDTKTFVALYIVLSGGFSNLIDRVFRGHVVDFIKIYKFPNFNLADIYILIGWLLIIIYLFNFSRKK